MTDEQPLSGAGWARVEGIPEFDPAKLRFKAVPFGRTSGRKFSWRNRGVLPPVADQGEHQTCFSHSLVAALRARRQIVEAPIPPLDAEMFHACTMGLPLSQGNYLVKRSLDNLCDVGAPRAGSGYAPGLACKDFTPSVVRAASYNSASTPELVKGILATYAPLVALVSAGESLKHIRDDSIYRDQIGEAKTFNHAMLLIGYDDEEQCWIVQNSMGSRWGQKGFGRIAYGSASILVGDFWCYVVE
ncbi:C1 family peptidase [Erythrobacter sp. BLCC-B19]|uniref:C1 family peptidase n=1 Tax=Erythrobacter sp. BLCC-B19 TaxID=3025315 RepID=UPI00236041FC|nr:C1 family peptidase [Erythrobacter sp. BLCC-B19]WDA40334.1 C1 family peptidase [Erythrobacter sp. BLCC-B19]